MAQFGKRNGGIPRRPDVPQADVSAALAVVKRGKVPAWTSYGPAYLVIVALCLAGLLWHLTTTYAGEILRDHRLAGTWQTASDLQAVYGSCRRVELMVTCCSATIR